MSRMVFAKGEQKRYLTTVKKAVNARVETLALNCGVHPRTIRDWQREKYRISQEAATSLQKISGIPCPRILEILPDWLGRSYSIFAHEPGHRQDPLPDLRLNYVSQLIASGVNPKYIQGQL